MDLLSSNSLMESNSAVFKGVAAFSTVFLAAFKMYPEQYLKALDS